MDGAIQRYVYDNDDIIALLDGRNMPTEVFTHGPGIDEPLIMAKSGGAKYLYHADGLGSITAITAASSQIVETYSYKAYGEPTTRDRTGAILSLSSIANPYAFTARELDVDSGQYYYRARYYDWRRGAFTQEDVAGFIGTTNLYAYVHDNPVIFSDPSGNYAWIVAAGAGAAAGFAGDVISQFVNNRDMANIDYGHAGVSAITGAIGGAMLTLPGAGNYGAALLIGAVTGGGSYLLTTAPADYSAGGYLLNSLGGAVGGMLGGPIKPYANFPMSPFITADRVVSNMISKEVLGISLGSNMLGSLYSESMSKEARTSCVR